LKNTNIRLAVGLVITALVLVGCSGGGSKSDADSCELVCDINTESYTIEISCESGTMSTELLGDQTQESQYDSSGNKTGIKLNLNQARTYENTQNVYTMVGTIEIDLVNDKVNHDIEVTGGEFGDTPQTCTP
jgi:hypothetical protein